MTRRAQASGHTLARVPGYLLLLGAWFVLGSCSTVQLPDLQAPIPAHWPGQPALATDSPVDLHGWWHAFQDPALDALIQQSLRSNPDVAQAEERLRAERILYGATDAPFLPRLRLGTDHPVDPDAVASYFTVGFDAQWELGLFGRRQSAERLARGRLGAAKAALREARVSLVAEIARNWIDLRAAQQALRVRKHMCDLERLRLQWISRRIRLRLAAPAERDQARARLAQAQAALGNPQRRIGEASRRLALLLGHSKPDATWLTAGKLPELGRQSIKAAPAELLRTRPDIARAESGVLQAAGELGIARANRFPDIGIGGSIIWSSSTLTHREPEIHSIVSLGPRIDIPLFDWGLRQARAHADDHLLKASVLAYRQAVLAGVADVENALANLALQRTQQQAGEENLTALDRLVTRASTRLRLGLDSPFQRTGSMLARDQAQLELIDSMAARDIAFVALYKALGGAPKPESDAIPAASARLGSR